MAPQTGLGLAALRRFGHSGGRNRPPEGCAYTPSYFEPFISSYKQKTQGTPFGIPCVLAPQTGLEPVTHTLAVPKSCFPLVAWATFDRGAIPFSLYPPPAAVGGDAVNSRRGCRNKVLQNQILLKMPTKNHPFGWFFVGASNRARTCDTAVNSRVLYRLSY